MCAQKKESAQEQQKREIQRPHRDQNNNERCEFIGKDADVCKRME